MKIQKCRNGCGVDIVVQIDAGKWKPFVYDLNNDQIIGLHNCPKSNYKRDNVVNHQSPAQQSSKLKENDITKFIPQFLQTLENIERKINQLELLLQQISKNTHKNIETIDTIDHFLTTNLKNINKITSLSVQSQIENLSTVKELQTKRKNIVSENPILE
ncbi:MAG: hypothetical protein ACPKPY_05485 [Nitrososphaeraceae archaeon]